MRTKSLFAAIGAVLVSILMLASPSQAFNPYLSDFNAAYGTAGSQLDTCGLCHYNFNGGGEKNPYGVDYGVNHDFGLIEGDDSDLDGANNLNEIINLFMPGLTCDNIGMTSNGPADLADYVDLNDVGCGVVAEPDINLTPPPWISATSKSDRP